MRFRIDAANTTEPYGAMIDRLAHGMREQGSKFCR